MHLLAVLWPGCYMGKPEFGTIAWQSCGLVFVRGGQSSGHSPDPVRGQLLCGDGEAQGTCWSRCGPPLCGKVGLSTFIYLSSVPGATWLILDMFLLLRMCWSLSLFQGGKSHLTSSFRLIRCHTFRQHLLKYADIYSCVQLICACVLPEVQKQNAATTRTVLFSQF